MVPALGTRPSLASTPAIPYAILVSEVMLQQTQVDRVVPRYDAWLERWPTVERSPPPHRPT